MKKYLIKIMNYLVNKYYIIKEKLLCAENRRNNLTTILFLLVLHLFLLISASNAYYHDESNLVLLHAKIGDKESLNYDYILRIYAENDNNDNNKTYRLVNSIPAFNYRFSSYSCKNNSELIYDSVNKITNVTIDGKESCSIYFDLDSKADIIVNLYLEDSLDTNSYTKSNNIIEGINYELNEDLSTCKDINDVIIENNIRYDNNIINIDTIEKSYCDVFLDVSNE